MDIIDKTSIDNHSNTFSILIPVYNEAENIEKLLALICSIAPEEVLEILVCDNASTDTTIEVVRKWEKKSPLVRLISEDTWGKSATWNHLVEQAKASNLIFFDADVMPAKDCLNLLIEATQHNDYIVYTGRRNYRWSNSSIQHWLLSLISDPVLELCLIGSCYATQKDRLLSKMRQFGYLQIPDVFADDVFLQALLQKEELLVIQDCIVNVTGFSFHSFIKVQARKQAIKHELHIQYPQLGKALQKHYPETVSDISQMKFVLTGGFNNFLKIRWVASGFLKWLLACIYSTQIKTLGQQYVEVYCQYGGSYLLRTIASTRSSQL